MKFGWKSGLDARPWLIGLNWIGIWVGREWGTPVPAAGIRLRPARQSPEILCLPRARLARDVGLVIIWLARASFWELLIAAANPPEHLANFLPNLYAPLDIVDIVLPPLGVGQMKIRGSGHNL